MSWKPLDSTLSVFPGSLSIPSAVSIPSVNGKPTYKPLSTAARNATPVCLRGASHSLILSLAVVSLPGSGSSPARGLLCFGSPASEREGIDGRRHGGRRSRRPGRRVPRGAGGGRGRRDGRGRDRAVRRRRGAPGTGPLLRRRLNPRTPGQRYVLTSAASPSPAAPPPGLSLPLCFWYKVLRPAASTLGFAQTA